MFWFCYIRMFTTFQTRHIVDVLLNEGNYVEIYAKYMDNIHIRMFDGLIVKPIDKLTQSCIEKADFIYSAASFAAMPEFLEVRKYILHFSTAFMDEIANFQIIRLLKEIIKMQ